MATISPYGDPNAHGPLSRSLCFRRYKNKVLLQAFPNPVARSTAATLAQRQKLTDAALAYSLLPKASLDFYRKRSSQKQMTSRNLFMSADMKKYLPSILKPIPCKSIEDMVIFKPVGLYSDEIKISITNEDPFGGADLEASCIGWWKFEDVLAEIGTDFTEIGDVSWLPAKFNNGAATIDDADHLTAGSGSWFPSNNFAIESWIKTAFATEDGVPDDAGLHTLFNWYSSISNNFYFRIGPTGTYFVNRVNGLSYYLPLITSINWDAATLHHLLLVYVQAKIGDDQQRIYLDGDLIENRNLGAPVQTQTTGITQALVNYNGVQNWTGLEDNLRIYHNITQPLIDAIRSNKNNEDFSLLTCYGHIYDTENIYTKEDEAVTPSIQKIIITTPSGHPAHIPFRYLIRVEWKNFEDEIFNSVIRLPELIMEASETIELFLSKDWSVYWDRNFHRIACTNQL